MKPLSRSQEYNLKWICITSVYFISITRLAPTFHMLRLGPCRTVVTFFVKLSQVFCYFLLLLRHYRAVPTTSRCSNATCCVCGLSVITLFKMTRSIKPSEEQIIPQINHTALVPSDTYFTSKIIKRDRFFGTSISGFPTRSGVCCRCVGLCTYMCAELFHLRRLTGPSRPPSSRRHYLQPQRRASWQTGPVQTLENNWPLHSNSSVKGRPWLN